MDVGIKDLSLGRHNLIDDHNIIALPCDYFFIAFGTRPKEKRTSLFHGQKLHNSISCRIKCKNVVPCYIDIYESQKVILHP